MALKLVANYSKRLGLPGYSSHQFSVSVETEISSKDDIQAESSRLYQVLQQSVDEEIQHTGFVPTDNYGKNGANGHNHRVNGNGHANGSSNGQWHCSDKQRELILKFVDEHGIPKDKMESLSIELCGAGVKLIDKAQASRLIAHLIEEYGGESTTVTRRGYQPKTTRR